MSLPATDEMSREFAPKSPIERFSFYSLSRKTFSATFLALQHPEIGPIVIRLSSLFLDLKEQKDTAEIDPIESISRFAMIAFFRAAKKGENSLWLSVVAFICTAFILAFEE